MVYFTRRNTNQTKMKKPLLLWGEIIPLVCRDVIIVNKLLLTEAATDLFDTSECIIAAAVILKVMDTFHRCLLLPVGKVDACADDWCSSGYVVSMCLSKPLLLCDCAAANSGDDADELWTTLLMNDVTAKLCLCVRPSVWCDEGHHSHWTSYYGC